MAMQDTVRAQRATLAELLKKAATNELRIAAISSFVKEAIYKGIVGPEVNDVHHAEKMLLAAIILSLCFSTNAHT